MKLPAVAIAAAFVGGSLLGWWNPLHSAFGVPFVAGVSLLACAILLLAVALILRKLLLLAALASFLCWTTLGILGMALTRQPLPAEHILNRVAARSVDLKTPQRWHGRLRGDPESVPWGYNFQIELTGVDSAAAGGVLPVEGGLRLAFSPKENDPSPNLHAGDEVVFLTQARLPQFFRDEGAFDRRSYLSQQGVDLQATLRSGKLLERVGTAPPSLSSRLAHMRTHLRDTLDRLCANSPHSATILRAMLLGDRSFIDRNESLDYQKTGTIHVLVVAGLHLAALAWFLSWLFRRLRLPSAAASILVLLGLAAYLCVVEQRAPVLRAAVMAAVLIVGQLFHRRLELLNSAALAALVLLVANPRQLLDTGFQLSFLAIFCIAAVAVPFIDLRMQPYLRAVTHWRDVSRDRIFTPALAQFRLDLRDFLRAIGRRVPRSIASGTQDAMATLFRGGIGLAAAFVVSIVLQLGMLPLLVREFHRVSTLGPVVNLFAVPLVSLIVPLGFVALAAGLLYAPLAHLASPPLLWLVALQDNVVSFFAKLPHSNYRVPGPPLFVILLFFLALLLLAVLLRLQSSPRWSFALASAALLAFTVIIATYPFHPQITPGALEVNVLDVGQGDSILVVSPSGSLLLVDGGGAFQGFPGREEHVAIDPGEDAVSTYLWSRGIKRIDAVAVTHAHQDHIGGLSSILQNFYVSRFLVGRDTAAPAMRHIENLAAALHIPVERETRGQSFDWDGVHVDVLWPDNSSGAAPTAKNNDSLVLRLRYKERAFLLPGDAEKQVEYTMLRGDERELLHADVLKVGHHGSKNSSMPEFLDMVSPQIAVISDGEENPYGHPSPVLLNRLNERGVRILRTDEQGAVQIQTDGHELKVSCFLPCPAGSAELDARSSRVQPPDNHQRKQQE